MTKQQRTTLRRFVQGALAEWLRDHAKQLGYEPSSRRQAEVTARRIVNAVAGRG